MKKHLLKNFSNRGFIQSIDKPQFLAPLLFEYKEYFKRQGIDVEHLSNNKSCTRRMLKAFTQPRAEIPSELLEVLQLVDDFADESGRELILEQAARMRICLSPESNTLSLGEFALKVLHNHGDLLRLCHPKLINRKIKKKQEHRNRKGRSPDPGDAQDDGSQQENEWHCIHCGKKLGRLRARRLHLHSSNSSEFLVGLPATCVCSKCQTFNELICFEQRKTQMGVLLEGGN